MHVCEYCNKSFNRRYNLTRHQSSAKKCLKLRADDDPTELTCKECGKTFCRPDSLARHKRKCQQPKSDVKKLTENLGDEPKDVLIIKVLEMFNEMHKQVVELSNTKTPSTTSRNSLIDKLQPITKEDLTKYLDSLSLDFIRYGAKGYADFAGNYPFKNKVICTDRSRKKIQYKNEDGTTTTDGRLLARRFFQAISEKNSEIINREYAKLHGQIDAIVQENKAGTEDISDILTRATFIQDMLIKTKNAAEGKDDDFIQEFLTHLSKKL